MSLCVCVSVYLFVVNFTLNVRMKKTMKRIRCRPLRDSKKETVVLRGEGKGLEASTHINTCLDAYVCT